MSDKPVTTATGTLYARPQGTRDALRIAIEVLRDIEQHIHMPADFGVKARNLIVDMENERNRREQ